MAFSASFSPLNTRHNEQFSGLPVSTWPNYCSKSTCPFCKKSTCPSQIINSNMLWSVLKTGRYAHFSVWWEFLAWATVLTLFPHMHLPTRNGGLQPTHSIILKKLKHYEPCLTIRVKGIGATLYWLPIFKKRLGLSLWSQLEILPSKIKENGHIIENCEPLFFLWWNFPTLWPKKKKEVWRH
jgi:hypothetical protein